MATKSELIKDLKDEIEGLKRIQQTLVNLVRSLPHPINCTPFKEHKCGYVDLIDKYDLDPPNYSWVVMWTEDGIDYLRGFGEHIEASILSARLTKDVLIDKKCSIVEYHPAMRHLNKTWIID